MFESKEKRERENIAQIAYHVFLNASQMNMNNGASRKQPGKRDINKHVIDLNSVCRKGKRVKNAINIVIVRQRGICNNERRMVERLIKLASDYTA